MAAENLLDGESLGLVEDVKQLDEVADDLARGEVGVRAYPIELQLQEGDQIVLSDGALDRKSVV